MQLKCWGASQQSQTLYHGCLQAMYATSYCLDPKRHKDLGVYCAKDSDEWTRVVEVPQVVQKKYKFNILAVVNAKLGPVYLEFVSGTCPEIDYRNYSPDRPPETFWVSHTLRCESTCLCAARSLAMYT